MDELYKDLLKDGKHQRTILATGWILTVILAIVAIVGLSAYYQNKITNLISESEFVTQYELITDNESFNSGNITVSK